MEDYNLKIIEFSKEEHMLDIAIRVKGPYESTVKEPKVTVIFSNMNETRRLPVIIQAYFPEPNMDTCNILAKYRYNLKHLFFEETDNEQVELYFELTYGKKIMEGIPFTISGDVNLNEQGEAKVSKENNSIIFNIEKELEDHSLLKKTLSYIRPFTKSLWGIILFMIVIPITPLFLIEAILAFFGLAKRAPRNNRTGIMHILNHVRWRINSFVRENFGLTDFKMKILKQANKFARYKKVKENRIVFISSRRKNLTGNFEFIYRLLKEDAKLQIKFVLDDRELKAMSLKNIILFGYYCGTSKIILIDDYTPLIHKLHRREGTLLIQLWHACGAFKTFGYSRLGKPGGQKQSNPAHRNYDYAIVSSKEIAKHYAEGFGISIEKVVATGIPRTDIFFDEVYKNKVRQEFYEKYPKLRDKKIMLFAPTFRGNGKLSGFYPVDKFDVACMYEKLKGEYGIIIKHHPFVYDRNIIPEEYQDYIIDLSLESEINDLLFVTDLLVTDYSSVIFEASLLDIPMLFYAYDLYRYISTRGFYYEYENFVPGKIVSSFGQAIKAIKNQDFETDKNTIFKNRFFDDLDGKSSERTVKLIYESLKLERDGEKL